MSYASCWWEIVLEEGGGGSGHGVASWRAEVVGECCGRLIINGLVIAQGMEACYGVNYSVCRGAMLDEVGVEDESV